MYRKRKYTCENTFANVHLRKYTCGSTLAKLHLRKYTREHTLAKIQLRKYTRENTLLAFNGLFVRFFVRMRFRQKFRTEHFPSMVCSCGSSCLTGTRADWRALLKFSTQIYLGDFLVPASQLPSRTRQTTHEALLFQTASQLPSRTRQTTPPLRQPALTGPVHAFSVHFSAPPNTFNIFILRQKCSRIALVRFRLERLQKLTFYNQTNEEN